MRNSAMMTYPPNMGMTGYPFGPAPFMYGPPPPVYYAPPRIPIIQRVEMKKEEKIDFHAKWNSNIEHSVSCPFCEKKFFFKERVLLEKLKIEEASKKIEKEWKSESKVQTDYGNSNSQYKYNGSYKAQNNNDFNFDTNFVREKYTKSEIMEDDGNQNFGYKLNPPNGGYQYSNYAPVQAKEEIVKRNYDGVDTVSDYQSDNSMGQNV